MYPLLLKSPVKDYLWGGERLIKEYGFETDKDKIAEAWVFSCHKDGESVVLNGELKGKTLSEALEIFGKDCLGKNGNSFPYFPLLIKLIDAKSDLSVQVHPDDEYALKNEGEFGKTEMWYIVDCEEGAKLVYGLNREVTKEELEYYVNEDKITDICNFVPVHKGDVFFISAGTLHAIGEGILIAEIQQNSNTTYRVSDYGRLGADGKPRQLHKKQAIDVISRQPSKTPYGNVGETKEYDFGSVRKLASCDFFTTKYIELSGTAGLGEKESFSSVLLLEGEVTASFGGEELNLKKGDSMFIPANMEITLKGKGNIIYSYV